MEVKLTSVTAMQYQQNTESYRNMVTLNAAPTLTVGLNIFSSVRLWLGDKVEGAIYTMRNVCVFALLSAVSRPAGTKYLRSVALISSLTRTHQEMR